MTYRTIVFVLAAAGALSCAAASVVAAVGEDVVLTPGKSVRIGTSGARLSFDTVTADSRCATDVQCVWAGNAAVRVRVWGDTGAPRTVELNSTVAPKEALIDGYVLRFVALAPAPVSTASIKPADYRLTVRLERP